ncbi:MAG: aspartate-semialdehyde dehydrogenase [Candidatus Marinamargulisbacteria bacterium]
MSKKYRIGVVGATGVVGKEIIKILESRKFPVESLRLFASERSLGQTVLFNGERLDVEVLSEDTLRDVDMALFSAGSSISKKFCPLAAERGIICIDNTSHYRMVEGVPLVVPEVNASALKNHRNIIANPNCSTAQMMVVLKPIMDAVGLERVVVSTYQSVSGAGSSAITELEDQSRANLSGQTLAPSVFPHPIAFNVIPQIDVFLDNGYTKEEMKMINETKKILGDDNLCITATAVRVPVFVGHSEAINIETKAAVSPAMVRDLLAKAPGVSVMDDPHKNHYPTPRDVAGKDDVLVGRIRTDVSKKNTIELWCVGDNLRKGAALNAVQIAEALT